MKKAFYLILAGVAIGLLIAPEKGTETIRKIKEGFEDWKDEAMNRVDGITSKAKDLANRGKSMANDVRNEAMNG